MAYKVGYSRKGNMNTPNKITLTRFVLTVIMVVFLVVPWWPKEMTNALDHVKFSIVDIIATAIFIIASVTDAVDGHLARKHNLVTNFGKFMDPLADKFLVNSSLIILAVQQPNNLPVILVVLMLGRDIAVDGLRLVASSQGEVIAANIFGKLKTVFQMVFIPIIMLRGFPFSLFMGENTYIMCIILMSITCAMSVVSGIIYIIRGHKVLKGGN